MVYICLFLIISGELSIMGSKIYDVISASLHEPPYRDDVSDYRYYVIYK